MRDYIENVIGRHKLVYYNSLHSYGQYILLPWAYTQEQAPNYQHLHDLALKVSFTFDLRTSLLKLKYSN